MPDNDLVSQQEARDAVEAAHAAGSILARSSQAKIDEICGAMAEAALAQAERLGREACEETGFGRAEDKKEKNRFAAEDIWNHFKSLKTVGVVADRGSIVEIASPRGVIAAIIPSTNPTSTAIFKNIIAIKSRNTIVLSPHPSAAKCIAETTRIMREAGEAHGLPPGAISCLTTSTIEGTEALMKHKNTAVILATGGLGLVRAAYSSGKPAFGVGPGNVPVFIERTANVSKAVADILTGTCFDNGTICASEQAVVADASMDAAVREEFGRQGGHFLSAADADAVAKILLTPQRTLNPGIVGKSARHIAELAGITVPDGTRCLLAECGGVGRDFPWSIEKLSPLLAYFVADGLEAAAGRCQEVLRFGGMGHTAGMHTQDRDAAVRFGDAMPASRIVINSPTTHGAIGLSTDLAPSMTLGCGSWGGNVTSDNISPIHLMDIKRVAFESKPVNAARPVEPRPTADPAANATVAALEGSSIADRRPDRAKIAAMVDRFLSEKLRDVPAATASAVSGPEHEPAPVVTPVQPPPPPAPAVEGSAGEAGSPVKTVIHEFRPQSLTENGFSHDPMDFVSEADVRAAIDKGAKIFITKKTIVTPAARDLGEEKDVFARV